jgi:hypothetical protein
VRYDPRQYNYLYMGSVNNYQGCFNYEPCRDWVMSNGADPARYINIFVFGYHRLPDPRYPQCNECPSGAAVVPDGVEDYQRGWIYMDYDQFEPANQNSASAYDAGGDVLIHEMGHYLGLQHTHEGGCSDNDGVADTPADQDANQQVWRRDMANRVCIPFKAARYAAQGSVEQQENDQRASTEYAQLASVGDSCPDSPGYDNVFNFMSYHGQCRLEFTKGQIERMWAETYTKRPAMFQASAVYSS